ncbi:MAG TPA: DUF3892 domain-containing protein [Mycobacteriales bacterium]|nr:DUF3892 domain-containing protein [Mycobacteriales bacterium]
MSKRIVAVRKSRYGHGHLTEAGIGTVHGRPAYWEGVDTVRANLASQTYYTVSPTSGAVAYVHRVTCECGVKTIQTDGDRWRDNNLDNLPTY